MIRPARPRPRNMSRRAPVRDQPAEKVLRPFATRLEEPRKAYLEISGGTGPGHRFSRPYSRRSLEALSIGFAGGRGNTRFSLLEKRSRDPFVQCY